MSVALMAETRPIGRSASMNDASVRALAIWPRLDPRALARCGGDPKRIARLVARRTALSPEDIEAILINTVALEIELWFG